MTATTEDDAEINVPREAAEIIPRYMACEPNNDDEVSMAVQYRNALEDSVSKLQILV